MENKKGLITLITVLAVIILGAAGYYFFSKASADAFEDTACRGLTGGAWRNCATNATTWKYFQRDTSPENFKKVINKLRLDNGIINPIVTGQKVTFTPSPTNVATGITSKLTWTLENVTSCKATGGDTTWAAHTPIVASGNYVTEALTTTKVYTLTCTGTDSKVVPYTATVTVGNLPPPPPPVACTGVTVYPSANFDGTGVCLEPRSYDTAALVAKGVANDSIASIKVPTGHLATIYQSDAFSYNNESMAITADKADLTTPVEDSVSSIRVYGACTGATVFSGKNYTGDSSATINAIGIQERDPGYGICLPEGTYTDDQLGLLGVSNDTISSIKVATGKKVTAYKDGGLTGTDANILTADTTDLSALTPDLNDAVSSITVATVE